MDRGRGGGRGRGRGMVSNRVEVRGAGLNVAGKSLRDTGTGTGRS